MVQAISRGFELLRLVSGSSGGLRLYELAERMGLKRTTVFNIAKTLVKEGMLEKDEDSRYRLGSGMAELSRPHELSQHLKAVGKGLLELKRELSEGSYIYSELRGDEIVGIFSIGGNVDDGLLCPENMYLNPYYTVCGMVFMSFMPGDMLLGLKMKYPFEYKGIEVWRSEGNLLRALEETRGRGYAESPATPVNNSKFGIPVFKRSGMLQGVITANFREVIPAGRLADTLKILLATAEKITQGE